MTRHLASGWERDNNDECDHNDVCDSSGDVVCVAWDTGDGSFTVQGYDAEWDQCDLDDVVDCATLEDAEKEVARRVAESGARRDRKGLPGD